MESNAKLNSKLRLKLKLKLELRLAKKVQDIVHQQILLFLDGNVIKCFSISVLIT